MVVVEHMGHMFLLRLCHHQWQWVLGLLVAWLLLVVVVLVVTGRIATRNLVCHGFDQLKAIEAIDTIDNWQGNIAGWNLRK